MAIKMPEFSKSFAAAAKGAGATRDRARTTFIAVEKFSRTAKWGRVDPENMTSKQVFGYVRSRLEEGITPRVMQNEISHIRRALSGAGRDLGDIKNKNNNWSNHRLGVPEASRIGGKAAADIEKFRQADLPRDVRICLDLVPVFGTRVQEAVKSTNLDEWAKTLQKAAGAGQAADVYLSSDAGSKGGRPRYVHIHAEKVENAIKVVAAAIDFKKENGGKYLVQSTDLEAALKRVSNECTRAGLVGDDSIHGLRRYWAGQQKELYLAEGLSEKQALSRLSCDLGHGDGRGRWVENNYIAGSK